MNDPQRDNLEHELASLTQWQGETGELWRNALRESKKATEDTLMHRLRRNWRVLSIAASLMLVAAVALTMSNTGRAVRYARSYDPPVAASPAPPQRVETDYTLHAHGIGGGGGFGGGKQDAPGLGLPSPQSKANSSADGQRQIIRTATIELEVADVRSTFIKVQHLISAARGEFIADSSLTGAEPHTMRGNLTLRVEAGRMSGVLNQLRELGAVVSEKIGGEDVTTQMVDLDARLRNEQRIEQELLKLLDTRADSPLGEVLEVRRQLDGVRLRIELLAAQQQHLTRQVALATVLVFLRPADAKQQETQRESGMLDHLRETFGDALRWGVAALIDSTAGLFGIIIGGLLWWSVLGLGGWLVWRRIIRPQHAQAA